MSSDAPFLARLDRLRLTAFHWRLAGLCGLLGALGVMQLSLFTFASTAAADFTAIVQTDVRMSDRDRLLAAATLAGLVVGSTAGGIADRRGRRWAVVAAMALSALATLGSAAAPSYEVLAGARAAVGAGVGMLLPVLATLVAEYAPSNRRGTLVLITGALWTLGLALAAPAVLSLLIVASWRAPVALGGLALALGVVLARRLPESPRFLASRNRAIEADAAVRRAERAAGAALISIGGIPRATAVPTVPTEGRARPGIALLIAAMWFSLGLAAYGLFIGVPAATASSGELPRFAALTGLLAVTITAGTIAFARTVERFARNAVASALLVLRVVATVALIALTSAGALGSPFVLAAGAVIGLLTLGAWCVVLVLSTEFQATARRATMAGAAAAGGWLGALVGVLVIARLRSTSDNVDTLLYAALLVAALGALALPRSNGESLEDLAR